MDRMHWIDWTIIAATLAIVNMTACDTSIVTHDEDGEA